MWRALVAARGRRAALLLLLLLLGLLLAGWRGVLLLLLLLLCRRPPRLGGALPADGKAVLITGCDKGFGHALARRLHAGGFTVFAGCLLRDRGGDGARELGRLGSSGRMHVLQLDVCREEEVDRALGFVRDNLVDPEQGLWGLVNNAGIASFGDVEFTSLEKYKRVADTNLWGAVRVTKAFLPLIRRARGRPYQAAPPPWRWKPRQFLGLSQQTVSQTVPKLLRAAFGLRPPACLPVCSSPGRVVNVASMLGWIASPLRSSYCISKFGLEAFTDCLRQEMYRWGVAVVAVEPSNFIAATGILTREGVEAEAEQMWHAASETVRVDYGEACFRQQLRQMAAFTRSGLRDVTLFLDDISDALTARRPYARYNPMEARWWVRLQAVTHLPTALADWLYIE